MEIRNLSGQFRSSTLRKEIRTKILPGMARRGMSERQMRTVIREVGSRLGKNPNAESWQIHAAVEDSIRSKGWGTGAAHAEGIKKPAAASQNQPKPGAKPGPIKTGLENVTSGKVRFKAGIEMKESPVTGSVRGTEAPRASAHPLVFTPEGKTIDRRET